MKNRPSTSSGRFFKCQMSNYQPEADNLTLILFLLAKNTYAVLILVYTVSVGILKIGGGWDGLRSKRPGGRLQET